VNKLWFWWSERFVMQNDKSNLILQRDLVFRWDLEPNPDPDLHRFKDSDPSSICFCFRQLVFFFRDMSRWDTYQPFDPVPPTGDTIMEESWLLCLDEFMVRKTFQHFPAVLRIRIHLIRIRGSESSILGWTPIQIQGFYEQKLKKNYDSCIFFYQKLQFTCPPRPP